MSSTRCMWSSIVPSSSTPQQSVHSTCCIRLYAVSHFFGSGMMSPSPSPSPRHRHRHRLAIAIAIAIAIPIAIPFPFLLFHRYSTAIYLNAQNDALPAHEARKRRQFANRIRLSGVAMLANTVALVLFVVIGNLSSASWLYTIAFVHETSNATGSFQITAIQTPKSRQSGATSGGRNNNKVAPSSHTAGAKVSPHNM